MKRVLIIFSAVFLLASCSENKSIDSLKSLTIRPHAIGPIKIGMSIKEAENILVGYEMEIGEATSFGLGGGSPIYLYSEDGEFVLGVVPALNIDTVVALIAIHPELKTVSGLNSRSTAGEIASKYENVTLSFDLMNGWEVFKEPKTGLEFVFMTDSVQVGKYPDIERKSEVFIPEIKSDWITIW